MKAEERPDKEDYSDLGQMDKTDWIAFANALSDHCDRLQFQLKEERSKHFMSVLKYIEDSELLSVAVDDIEPENLENLKLNYDYFSNLKP